MENWPYGHVWVFLKLLPAKLEAHNSIGSLCILLQYNFPRFPTISNLFRHNNAPVHKVSIMKTWFVKVGEKELEWSAHNPDLNQVYILLATE